MQIDEGELWSFLRDVLEQGRSIEMDNQRGKYAHYELLSCRLDEAARERVDNFYQRVVTERGAG